MKKSTAAAAQTFVESLKKQSCLFGTLHIKAAAAMVTFMDLFFICHFDEQLYKNRASDLQYNVAFALIIYMLVMVLLAQFALHRNSAWMLLPLITTHVGFFGGSLGIYGHQIYLELMFVLKNNIHFGRLFMFALYRLIISFLNCYAIFILGRTYVMLRDAADPLSADNKVFEQKDESEAVFDDKDDSEIVLFEKVNTPKRPHNLVASPSPYSSPLPRRPFHSPTRSVRFTNMI